MRPQPMVMVADVEASSRWYQGVLGLRSGHGGPEYEMLLADDEVVLQLHRTEADEHPTIRPWQEGDGVVLYFATDELDAAAVRAAALRVEVAEELHENPLAHLRELWLRDPDGHLVVLTGR